MKFFSKKNLLVIKLGSFVIFNISQLSSKIKMFEDDLLILLSIKVHTYTYTNSLYFPSLLLQFVHCYTSSFQFFFSQYEINNILVKIQMKHLLNRVFFVNMYNNIQFANMHFNGS